MISPLQRDIEAALHSLYAATRSAAESASDGHRQSGQPRAEVIKMLERAIDLEYLATGDCDALGEVFEKAEADAEAVALFVGENRPEETGHE